MWKTRCGSCQVLVLFLCLSELLVVGLVIFSHGFLLTRQVVPTNSTCDDFKNGDASHQIKDGGVADTGAAADDGCWMIPAFRRTIILLIDALRYDFALYNSTLGEGKGWPYQNKMPVFADLMQRRPGHAQLSPFLADAPTTTMQRLTGLTTGSLPTFIDAGHNFASEEIMEDNIIDQLVKGGKRITVLGDDTWGGLFPGRFSRSHLYSSFNVMDLHTVDRGVEGHLEGEMARDDWEVIIAHFLGVDHCGHRYGPDHPEMAAKLKEMNDVVKRVAAEMDNDTLLLVLGDHGMTQTGDHGGDSQKEVEAALFAYSPTLHLPPQPALPAPVAQVDLVPTLALALGVPIPFSSLGKVMENILVTVGASSEEADRRRLRGLSLNMQQVQRYLRDYRALGNSYPQEMWDKLGLLQDEASTTSRRLSIRDQRKIYSEYLALAKMMCEEIWAKFDVLEITSGLFLMFSVLVMTICFIHCDVMTENNTFIIKRAVILTFIVNLLFLLKSHLSLAHIGSVASVLVMVWVLFQRKSFIFSKFHLSSVDCVALLLISILLLGSFSNSYVVVENYVVAFILVSSLTMHVGMLLLIKQGKKGRIFKLSGNMSSVASGVGLAVVCACVRLSGWYWRCREEQHWCIPSLTHVAFSGLPQHLHNWRYLTSVLSLVLLVWLPRRWLLLCGNLNGSRIGVLLVRFLPWVCGVQVAVFWALQAVITARNLDFWGHVIPPRMIFTIAVVYLALLSYVPLLIYELPSNDKRMNLQSLSDNPSTLIPQLYKKLLEKYRSPSSQGPSIPVVYGLATGVSASLVAVLTMAVVVVVLVAGDGLTPALLLLLLTAGASLLLLALVRLKTSTSLSEVMRPCWSAVCVWFILSVHGFYSTGHQPTFATLHWTAAFVGLEEVSSAGNWVPALLVGLNTFSSHMLFGLALPLVVLAPLALGVVFPNLRGNRFEGEEAGRGEFKLVEDPEAARGAFLSLALSYTALHAAKVFCTALAAFMLRRHLMVWKIFAPHLIFEAVGFIVTILSVLAGLGFTLRVLGALSSWSERLLKAN